jgi:hemolysin activation/secretion protein
VKARSFAANLNVGYPLTRHLKLTATLGGTYRDYAAGDDADPAFAVPSDHFVTRVEGRLAWDLAGWNATGRWSMNLRSAWEPWGYEGNEEWDEGKDRFQLYSVALAKTFDLPKFQRIDTGVSYVGTSNADRFSKVQFGFFGGTSLRGFRSGSLRAEEAFTAKVAYGVVVGKLFRLQALYDHAVVNDPAAGYDWVNFGGAGVSGQFSGPWSTLVQLEAGLPVVGRSYGQTGFVLYLVFLRSF